MPYETSPITVNCCKVAVLGSPQTGKTSLIHTYLANVFSAEYVPTVEDTYYSDEQRPISLLDHHKVTVYRSLQIEDIGGGPHLDSLRPVALKGAVCIVITYSAICRESLHDVERKWYRFARSHAAHTPIIIVGCKSDARPLTFALRSGVPDEGVGENEGRLLARKLGAEAFFETSALLAEGVNDVFEECVLLVEAEAERKAGLAAMNPISRMIETLKNKMHAGKKDKD